MRTTETSLAWIGALTKDEELEDMSNSGFKLPQSCI